MKIWFDSCATRVKEEGRSEIYRQTVWGRNSVSPTVAGIVVSSSLRS